MTAEGHGIFAGRHLVVFGCGDVGGELARQALARGCRVTALTRNAEKAAVLRAQGVAVVVADLASAAWHGEISGADLAVNAVSSGGGGLDGYRRSYLDGMRSVVSWTQARAFTGPLVYTSSTSVYAQDGGVRVDETAPAEGRDERSSLLVATEKLMLADDTARRIVLRLGGIYGPGRVNLVEQVRAGEVSGHPAHHLNLIHRDDVVSAIWAALGAEGREKTAVFNVTDGHAATKSEIVTWLAARLGVAVPRFTGAPGGGRRAVTPDRVILSDKLRTELGWRPRYRSYREGYATLLSPSAGLG